jgi:glycosyltransferase involved in cell wall biosynthesis
MRVAFVTCGLPGAGYHGGAVTCASCINELVRRGHEVTVVSLFDVSAENPYLSSRDDQVAELEAAGVRVECIEYESPALRTAGFRRYADIAPVSASMFPWRRTRDQVRRRLNELQPDVVFCYHFDALAAVYDAGVAPLLAAVGDIWHLPGLHRWQAGPRSFRKYTVSLAQQARVIWLSRRAMRHMLRACQKSGAFAAHYAEWLRQHANVPKAAYFRTPAHDPLGSTWQEQRRQALAECDRPRILMIGDITGTAAQSGLRLLMQDILPRLEAELGADGFDLHLVGGGTLDPEFAALANKPYVRMRGRVVPPDSEFLSATALLVPTAIRLGVRVRIITGFSYGSCIVTHEANRAGIPEIRHLENALVGVNGAHLAEQVLRALRQPELNERLQRNARHTFETMFSERAAAGLIADELEGLLVSTAA